MNTDFKSDIVTAELHAERRKAIADAYLAMIEAKNKMMQTTEVRDYHFKKQKLENLSSAGGDVFVILNGRTSIMGPFPDRQTAEKWAKSFYWEDLKILKTPMFTGERPVGGCVIYSMISYFFDGSDYYPSDLVWVNNENERTSGACFIPLIDIESAMKSYIEKFTGYCGFKKRNKNEEINKLFCECFLEILSRPQPKALLDIHIKNHSLEYDIPIEVLEQLYKRIHSSSKYHNEMYEENFEKIENKNFKKILKCFHQQGKY